MHREVLNVTMFRRNYCLHHQGD